jgi:HK97 family phage portal protein
MPRDVLHIPGLGFDGLVGYSPIAMAKNAIGMAIACEEYGAKFFANGAAPSGVLEHPGTIKDPKKVRETWQSQFGGSSNAGRVAVLEEGMKYTPISISPEQAQFLETRKFQINEIARIFRIPPHMVGDLEKSSFSNIEQQSLEFVKYTLDPWVIRWEQTLMRSLLSITFAILAFGRNKSNDNAGIQSRLAKIETDILYIRETLDDSKDWRKEFDERLRRLEKGGK